MKRLSFPTLVLSLILAQSAAAQSVSSEMVATMQRDFGLSREQVLRRLAFEAKAPQMESTLKDRLSSGFAGAWLNKEGTQLIVGVTNEADAATVRAAGAAPRMVTWTLEQLDQVKEALDRHARDAGSAIHGWYVDIPTNRVVVLADEASMSQSSVEDFVALAGRNRDMIQVVPSPGTPRLLHDIVGGDIYGMEHGTCSIGFSVIHLGPAAYKGYITAGHCGPAGTLTWGSNGHPLGTVVHSHFPVYDYGWVWTDPSWTPTSMIMGTNTRVAGSTEAVLLSSVCRSGYRTGWRCGIIEAKNQTVLVNGSYDIQVLGLTRTSACAEPGDSGGPFISGDQAQGMTSMGSGNCTSGGTSYFQPVKRVLRDLGVALVTGP